MAFNNGMKFSTLDQDNDESKSYVWTRPFGPWWHKTFAQSALNRRFSSNLYWKTLRRDAAKTSVMMIRKL